MTKKEFSAKILKCSDQHWRYILAGERNLGLRRAKLVAQLLSTSLEVWIDPEKTTERQRAWEKFNQ